MEIHFFQLLFCGLISILFVSNLTECFVERQQKEKNIIFYALSRSIILSVSTCLGEHKSPYLRTKELRKQQTFAEEILWTFLRTKPFGYKFRRQHPYSIYILDFYCHSLRLVKEVDGSIHNLEEIKKNDEIRQRHLEGDGLTFLRFTNDQIKMKPEFVFQQIESFLKEKLEKSNVSTT